jgi:hypothetical protein
MMGLAFESAVRDLLVRHWRETPGDLDQGIFIFPPPRSAQAPPQLPPPRRRRRSRQHQISANPLQVALMAAPREPSSAGRATYTHIKKLFSYKNANTFKRTLNCVSPHDRLSIG